jgi:aminopeptidase YwaD
MRYRTSGFALVLASVAAFAFRADAFGFFAPQQQSQPTIAPPNYDPEPVRLELAKARALSPELAAMLAPVINASWREFDRRAAMSTVEFMSQYWRLAGNAGFDASIDRARARLIDAGFTDPASRPPRSDRSGQSGASSAASAGSTSQVGRSNSGSTSSTPGSGREVGRPTVWIEEYPNSGKGWDYSVGTLALVQGGGPDVTLLSREKQHIALCINSFSTVPGGVVAPLVDVGRGNEDDYTGKDVKGAVVLGDASAASLWNRALAHGAIGVVSTQLPGYLNPDPPNATVKTPHDQWDILQWASMPYDETHKGFAFKSTPLAAATMRKALAKGPVKVHVTVESSFSTKPARMLIAEIPGKTLPNERMVIVAHVQEPGASDNASGVATLIELARALARNIRMHRIAQPDRTITMMLVEEITGSQQWLKAHQDLAAGVRYMFSMDMTGENVAKTGGSFLIERWPDPGAVWERPWDPHSEWGGGGVRANTLKGDLINDLHLAVCERVAARSHWVVRSNPYEGGSDHTTFGQLGVPALLNWHFTDRNYHASTDTPDKVSSMEMRNVAVSVTASAWLLASAKEPTALAVADLISRAGQARVAIEAREGGILARIQPDPAAAVARETTILDAWRKWYDEAVHSVKRLVVGPTSPDFDQKLDQIAAAVATKK